MEIEEKVGLFKTYATLFLMGNKSAKFKYEFNSTCIASSTIRLGEVKRMERYTCTFSEEEFKGYMERIDAQPTVIVYVVAEVKSKKNKDDIYFLL